jgi:hypothetical protein
MDNKIDRLQYLTVNINNAVYDLKNFDIPFYCFPSGSL